MDETYYLAGLIDLDDVSIDLNSIPALANPSLSSPILGSIGLLIVLAVVQLLLCSVLSLFSCIHLVGHPGCVPCGCCFFG